MNKQEHINYWVATADHDLETAETLFQSGRYDACLFFGHLMLEKVLKSLWVKAREDDFIPPKIHNLLKIATESKISINDEQKTLLSSTEDFNIETRYPDYRLSFYKLCTKEFTEPQFNSIKELYLCLRKLAQ